MEFLNRWFLCKKCGIYIRGLEAYIPHRKQASCRKMIPTVKLNRIKKIEDPTRRHNSRSTKAGSNQVEVSDSSRRANKSSLTKLSDSKPKKPHECLLCPCSFNFKSHLRAHQRVHTGEKPYKCDMCTKPFRWRIDLEQHVRKNHVEALVNCCDFCKKSFYDVKSLRYHTERYHTGFFAKNPQARVANETCSICQKVLKSKHDMRRHMRDVHFPQRLKCPKCPKQLKSKRILRDHIQAIHGDERPFECKVCGEAFHSRHRLTRHSTIHEGSKKAKMVFPCHYCNMTLASSWNLKIHERIHTKEKPFKCSVCDSRFRSRGLLNRHSKKSHFVEKV